MFRMISRIFFKLPSLLSIFKRTMCYIISRSSGFCWDFPCNEDECSDIICLIHSSWIFNNTRIYLFVLLIHTQTQNICSIVILIFSVDLHFEWIFLHISIHNTGRQYFIYTSCYQIFIRRTHTLECCLRNSTNFHLIFWFSFGFVSN